MRRLLAILSVLLLGAGLAACGDDDDSGTIEPATEDAAGEATTTTAAADEEAPPAGGVVLATAETGLGEVLVDAEGYTVYLFTVSEDMGACSDQCAQTWPAVPYLDGGTTSGGADAALLAAAPLGDGQQATYNGHRLYRYSGDAAPGDTNGHGVGDVWYALTPAGERAG